MGAEDLIINGKDVVVIEYHISDVFETPYAVARQNFYWVTSLPTVYFDGVIEYVGGNNTTSMYTTYLPFYEQRKSIPSDFTIDFQAANSQLTDYVVNVTVEKVAENNSSNLALIFALTETEIVYYWMGQEHVNYCERFMLPDASGTQLDFSESDILDISLSFSMDPGWELENCELAVWIQDLSTKEVQQAAKRSLTEIGDFPIQDAMVEHVYSPATLCSDFFEPSVEVKNLGSDELISLDIVYQVDNQTEQTYNWTGNIPYSESSVIDIPDVDLSVVNSSDFTVYVKNPNGQTDEFPYNDTLSTVILEAENVSSPVTLILKLDDYPEQTSWEVLNSNGTILYSGGNYSEPGVFVTESFELSNTDCYVFKIYDSYGDGLTGSGLYKLMHGTTIFHLGKEFAHKDEVQFGIGLTQVSDFSENNTFKVFPNPVSDILYFETGAIYEVDLFDLNGKIIQSALVNTGIGSMDLSLQEAGLYFLRIKGENGIETRKIVVKK